MRVIGHTSFLGHTGYANHTRNFFRELSKLVEVHVRNFSHVDDLSYLTPEELALLNPYDSKPDDINIVLNTTDHPYFYEKYKGPTIFYNVWESTRQPTQFFNKMLEADQFWCPSEWQKICTAEQGYPINKIKVVPEGIDPNIFKPFFNAGSSGIDSCFRFLLFGRWEHRKSTTEIIRTFLSTFKIDDNVKLVLSVDNNFAVDGFTSTEERLKHYGWNNDPRLEVVHFLPFQDYLDYLQKGNCLVSCSRSEGWNLPLIEAIACGTPSIHSDFSGQLEFAKGVSWRVDIKGYKPPEQMYGNNAPGLWAEPDFDHLGEVMKYIYNNYDSCKIKSVIDSDDIRKKYTWENAAQIALKHISNLDVVSGINKYGSTSGAGLNKENIKTNYHFVDGPFLELLGDGDKSYDFIIYDGDGKEYRRTNLKPNHWTKGSRKWFTEWELQIKQNDKLIFEHKYDAKDKKVLISFESKALGDTLAWVPYCEEFRIKHECQVIVSTFWNDLFKDEYRELEFVEPGTVTPNLYASYKIGCWDADLDKNKFDWRETPIQKVCADILGIEYKEIKPKIKKYYNKIELNNPLVTISEGSTAGCKQWQYPGGWQTVVDYLKKVGYDVAVVSKEPTTLKGIINLTDKLIEETISTILSSDFFLGVSSGLSWISWALDIPTVLISGCTRRMNEFQSGITRVINENVCYGCMNDKSVVFDRGDWHWCLHKNTPRHYECTKSISPEMVINKIENRRED